MKQSAREGLRRLIRAKLREWGLAARRDLGAHSWIPRWRIDVRSLRSTR